jgi:hypothetical protein
MGNIVIHARYAADGTIREIGERPEGLSDQEWFNFLCKQVPSAAQPLAGGRMVFRLATEQLETLKASAKAA